jgi:hypothetical protein
MYRPALKDFPKRFSVGKINEGSHTAGSARGENQDK